ncbi:MAG TPA: hypothetical protein VIX19_03985 [Terriglobales bacterium]
MPWGNDNVRAIREYRKAIEQGTTGAALSCFSGPDLESMCLARF